MRLAVLCVGRLRDGPERALCERYAKRIADAARPLAFTGPDVIDLPESRERRPDDRRRAEGRALAERLQPGLVVALDERGETLDSRAFAGRLLQARDAGQPSAQFLIGGPDGLDDELRGRAQLLLAFGRLTVPHQLVRVLILEQVYRALTVLGGHPYHRD